MNDFINRVIRAAKLDATLYSEVKADKEALTQAMVVVVLSGLASGVGTAKGWMGFLVIMMFSFVFWLVWAFIVYLIGTRLLPEPQTQTDYPGVLRTTGFAFAPHIFQIVAVLPGFMLFATVVAKIWTFIAIVFAIRQVLDYKTTFRAIWVLLISIIVQAVVLLFLTYVLGGGGKPV